jgi:hypothetical protein
MFYEAFEIDKLLICIVCNRKLEDPRILPCGKSFCHKCIEEKLLEPNTNRINCQNCGNAHEKPLNQIGFPQNLEVAKIVRLKSNEVFRGKLVKDFKTKSSLVKERADKLHSSLIGETGKNMIRFRCDKVRKDTKEALDEAHSRLDEFFKIFTREIEAYESECEKELELIQQNRTDIDKIVNESNEYYKKAHTILKQFQYDESELNDLLAEADELLTHLDKTSKKLECDMFKSVALKFVKNPKQTDLALIGQIKRQNTSLHYLENISNLIELDLLPKLSDINQETPLFTVEPFKNSSILCVYRAKDRNLNFSCLNKDGKMVLERKRLINDEKFLEIKYFQCYTVNNANVCVYTEEKQLDATSSLYRLRSYDKNLNPIMSIELLQAVDYLSTHDTTLFLVSKDNEKNRFYNVASYTPKLELIKKHGQGNKLKPYYFPDSLLTFHVSNQYFIITEPNENKESLEKITLINRDTGSIERTFIAKQPFNDCSIYLGEFILLFNLKSKTISAYNFECNLVNETKISEKVDILAFCLNREVYFLNENKIKLYFC